jgi:acetyl esterase/lipase
MDAFVPSPRGDAPRPAIMFVHGGGWAAARKEDLLAHALQFARVGFVCFSVDYRLVKPGRINIHPAQIDDVQLAMRWIREHADEFGADPKRLAAWGDSAGGHLVALLATTDTRDTSAPLQHHSSRAACVVDLYGPTDLTADFPTSGPFGTNVRKLVDDLLGAPARLVPDAAREASPIFRADATASPILIVQGTDDPLIPRDQSDRFHARLKALGVDTEYIVVEGAGHGFGGADAERVFSASRRFLAKRIGEPTAR